MSCYFRHIKGILDEVGIGISPSNKKQVDQAIHDIAGIQYKDCPAAWKSLKRMIAEDDGNRRFVEKLRQAVR